MVPLQNIWEWVWETLVILADTMKHVGHKMGRT